MTFLPIVARELRTASRRPGTFWMRTAMAMAAIAIGVFLYLANIEAPSHAIAQRIFSSLVVLGMFFGLFAGRRSSADCLSAEKREGTLGLLFLTDLKGYDIVLGKLAATSVNGFYCLLAAFPVLAVPILMGGITNGEFWRVILVMANTFLFSLAVGIFVSALSRDARRAMAANLLLLLLIIGIPGALAALLAYFLPAHKFYEQLLFTCPLYTAYLCDDSQFKFRKSFFWISLGLIHLLIWLLLALASYVVRHSWQDRPDGPRRHSWREAWRSWRYGPVTKRALYRRRLLNVNAFYWLAARARFKPLQVWLVLLFIAAWWLWASIQFGTLWVSESANGINLAVAVMLNVCLKCWIGLEACRQLAEDKRAGAFELVLSTPITVRDVLQGQWLALKRQFLLPTLVSLVIVLSFMVVALHHSVLDRGQVLAGWLGAILLFVADVTALAWTAMHCALVSKNPNQATVLAISRVIIAPAILFAAIMVLANVSTYTAGIEGPGFRFYFSCWLTLGLIADAVYGLSARHQLLTRFRQLASERWPKKQR